MFGCKFPASTMVACTTKDTDLFQASFGGARIGFVRVLLAAKDDTFSISALHLAIKVPHFSNSGHKNEKVTTLTWPFHSCVYDTVH
eukprot:SAG31_NODE_3782_length_3884_cov_1.601057_4_plen_86_part_00